MKTQTVTTYTSNEGNAFDTPQEAVSDDLMVAIRKHFGDEVPRRITANMACQAITATPNLFVEILSELIPGDEDD